MCKGSASSGAEVREVRGVEHVTAVGPSDIRRCGGRWAAIERVAPPAAVAMRLIPLEYLLQILAYDETALGELSRGRENLASGSGRPYFCAASRKRCSHLCPAAGPTCKRASGLDVEVAHLRTVAGLVPAGRADGEGRTIWRLRPRYVKDAGRAVQHMQKALTKMNVPSANVISDISGVSDHRRHPARRAGPLQTGGSEARASTSQPGRGARSLEGNWREDVLFELGKVVEDYGFAHKQMRECGQRLEQYPAVLPARTVEVASQPCGEEQAPKKKARVKRTKKSKKPQGNAPGFEMKGELRRIAGVDLTTIDGIGGMTAQRSFSKSART